MGHRHDGLEGGRPSLSRLHPVLIPILSVPKLGIAAQEVLNLLRNGDFPCVASLVWFGLNNGTSVWRKILFLKKKEGFLDRRGHYTLHSSCYLFNYVAKIPVLEYLVTDEIHPKCLILNEE